jgi:DNA invertase Pin-like site-specific DNA recombinase
MKTVAIYVRQSLDRDMTQLAVERQRLDCEKLCRDRGWNDTALYMDNNISASDGKVRPRYRDMVTDIAAGKIGGVVAWDADRLHRLPRELEDFIDLADRHQLSLATVGGDFDLSTPTGRANARMKGVWARMEMEQKAARQKRAALQRAQAGLPSWREAFGYQAGKDGPELHPVEAPLVRATYAALIAGASLGEMVRTLTEAGATGRTGKPWTASTLSLFLRAPRNAAIREYQGKILRDEDGEVVMGKWPALVSRETWETAQLILESPSRAPGRKSVRRHLLSGILLCGKCGATMSGNFAKGGAMVYSCKACRGVSIRANDCEVLMYAKLTDRLTQSDSAETFLVDQEADEEERKATHEALNALYARKRRLPSLFAKGMMDEHAITEAMEQIEQDIRDLIRSRDHAETPHVLEGAPFGEGAERMHRWLLDQGDRVRAIISALGPVTIQPCGKAGYLWVGESPNKYKIVNPDRLTVDWR